MIEIKSSMSADKSRDLSSFFTKKLKKNSHAPQGLELLDLSWEQASGIFYRQKLSHAEAFPHKHFHTQRPNP